MAKTTSKSKTAYFAQYKSNSKWAANRRRKLERQLKLHPNNAEQIQAALSNVAYRRGTPKNPQWSHTAIRTAQLFKKFTGRGSIDLFSANPKLQTAALQYHSPKHSFVMPAGKVDFSLGARAFIKR